MFRWCLGFLGRVMMRCYAFHFVKTKGQLATREQAAILVVAPHSSFLDCTVVFWSQVPSLVSLIENIQVPFFGSMFFLLLFIMSIAFKQPLGQAACATFLSCGPQVESFQE